jgi:hypothetical protein
MNALTLQDNSLFLEDLKVRHGPFRAFGASDKLTIATSPPAVRQGRVRRSCIGLEGFACC